MKYQIKILELAKSDLREIHRYIAETLKNPDAAKKRVSLIETAILSLAKNPALYPLVRDGYLASKGYRVIVAKNHLVFFTARDGMQEVHVMRVLYGRRDWLAQLRLAACEPDDNDDG
ncbi:MAG: type II toxin-antitoxin system RelE/ParE family toxin [Lachnospiraceae bacterium]|jgi:plasmid stabilization system protein ParE|nr:type II toxin-antitoxin system RelE/ParE family toxin [Lachnospiraceae bacterium]